MPKMPPQWPSAKFAVKRKRLRVASMEDLVGGHPKGKEKPYWFLKDFWKKVLKRGPNECWLWLGNPHDRYGIFWILYAPFLVHRLSFLFHHGTVDPDRQVMHSCNNKKCVNPSHLKQGTGLENSRDAARDLLYPIGERNGLSKLTSQQVLKIRSEFHSGKCTRKQLAKRYKTDPTNIWCIVRRKTWRHLQ